MTGPIFIVGASRSGTELTRSVLNRHPRIFIAAESHWFDDHRPRLRDPARPDKDEASALIDYLLSVQAHGYGARCHDFTDADRAALRERWQAVGPTADAAFAANCLIQADRRSATIWGEKTPRHVFRGDDMLAAFPTAKIIVCVRDPRGAVASYRDWHDNWTRGESERNGAALSAEARRVRQSYSLTLATLLWRSAAGAGRQLRRRHGDQRVFVLRFETLLNAPERTCRDLAAWLGVDFDPAMLEIAVTNSSHVGAETVRSFDPAVATRWRAQLSTDEAGYIAWLARREMAFFDYRPEHGGVRPGFAARRLALFPFEAVRALRANRTRIPRVGEYVLNRLKGLGRS